RLRWGAMGRRQRNTRQPPPAQAPPVKRRPSRALAAVVIAAVLVAIGAAVLLRRPPATDDAVRARLARLSPAPQDVNLVVLTLDTLRADHLGCYGFKDVETPNIDRL